MLTNNITAITAITDISVIIDISVMIPTLAEAILKLRPMLADRLTIRTIIKTFSCKARQLRDTTYFATIPEDIINIILEFLPDLRQTYTADQFALARNRYEEFINHYQSHIPHSTHTCLDRMRIVRDFDPIITENNVYFKMSADCRIMPATAENIYINGRLTKPNNDDTCDPTLPHTDVYFQYQWVLPCDLILIYGGLNSATDLKYMLCIDPCEDDMECIVRAGILEEDNSTQRESIKPNAENINKLCDDFGNFIDVSQYLPLHMMRLSPFTANPECFYTS